MHVNCVKCREIAEEPMRSAKVIITPAAILIAILSSPVIAWGQTATNWPNVFNDKAGTRYSPLDQINRSNVTNLSVAWRYHTADSRAGSTIECTPIVIDGVMYLTTVTTKVVALDAA